MSSLPAEEQLGCRAHHLGVPHWLERELGVHGLDTLNGKGFRLDLLLDHIPNRAHRAGEAEGDVHVAALIVHSDIVDQTELHEVHPDLRVYNVPQLVLHALLGYHSFTSCWRPFGTLIVKPQGRFSTRAPGTSSGRLHHGPDAKTAWSFFSSRQGTHLSSVTGLLHLMQLSPVLGSLSTICCG